MNNVKKYVIIISMIFFVVIGIVLIRNSFLVGFVNEFRGKNMSPSFSTIDECIDYQMDYYRDLLDSDNGATSYDLAELLYRLEYNNQLAIVFQSSDDTVWVYIIERSNSDDKISYRIIDSRTIFVLFDEWESSSISALRISLMQQKLVKIVRLFLYIMRVINIIL